MRSRLLLPHELRLLSSTTASSLRWNVGAEEGYVGGGVLVKLFEDGN